MPPHSLLLSLISTLHSHFPLSMDAKPPQLVASQPLNYQTWFLKVSIHCEGCRRKVKKVLKSIDGVFTATIDPQQQKVTVTGSVGVETLLRKLIRAGKHAEIWPENLDRDGKISGKGQKKKKKNEAREPQSLENKGTNEKNVTSKCSNSEKKSSNATPEKSPSCNQVPAEGGRSEGSGKKKKKNGGNGSERVNVSPTRQHSLSYSESSYPPMVYVATYNNILYPTPRIGVPSSPYMCAGLDQDAYHFQSPPFLSFEIFSDENVNSCSVM